MEKFLSREDRKCAELLEVTLVVRDDDIASSGQCALVLKQIFKILNRSKSHCIIERLCTDRNNLYSICQVFKYLMNLFFCMMTQEIGHCGKRHSSSATSNEMIIRNRTTKIL